MTKAAYRAAHRDALRAKAAEYREGHREELRVKARQYHMEHRAEANFTGTENRRRRRYNLTRADYEALLAKQGGACAVCREAADRYCVDHDHACCPRDSSCGKCVRGLLCHRCNRGLGQFLDDPRRLDSALEYLHRKEPGMGGPPWKCEDCGTWWSGLEHRCQPPMTSTGGPPMTSTGTFVITPYPPFSGSGSTTDPPWCGICQDRHVRGMGPCTRTAS